MKMIVFTGLPGTGKSSIAEAIARKLSIPVFAKDWLEAVLRRHNLSAPDNMSLGYVGYELLTTLAERQLCLGQSVILDSVASTINIRQTWYKLAEHYGASWHFIECICSDECLHRERLEVRQRNIPGWYELEWAEVERLRARYEPITEQRLVLDAVSPLAENIQIALHYLTSQ